MTLGQAPLFFGSRLDGVPHLPAQPSCIGIYATHNEDGPMSLQSAVVEMHSQSTPTTVIDGEIIIGFDRQRISEKLGL